MVKKQDRIEKRFIIKKLTMHNILISYIQHINEFQENFMKGKKLT